MPTFNDARLNHLLEVILQEADADGPYHQILDDYTGVSTIMDAMAIPSADVRL
jgi:hypothetical protein